MSNGKVTVTFTFDAPDLIDVCGSEEYAVSCIKSTIRHHLSDIRDTVGDITGEVEVGGELVPTNCYTVALD